MEFATTFPRGQQIRVNLSVYNAYNHLNASMAFLETDEEGRFHGMAYGLVPMIPTLTATFAF